MVGLTLDRSEGRRDLIEWMDRREWLRRFTTGQLPAILDDDPVAGVLAVLCNAEMSFEYPKQAAALIEALETFGLPRSELFNAVGRSRRRQLRTRPASERAADQSTPPPVDFLVGTPSRRMQETTLQTASGLLALQRHRPPS